MKHFLFTLIGLTFFISCGTMEKNDESDVDYTAENNKEIIDYIAQNNLTAKGTDSGLYYIVNNPGTGKQPTTTSNITVAYKGYFTNGTVFEKSPEGGVSFDLNKAIKGWAEGIPYFKEGGSGTLLVPSRLGYGSNTVGAIPAGSVLIFDIELISVN